MVKQGTKDKGRKVEIIRNIKSNDFYYSFIIIFFMFEFLLVGANIINYFNKQDDLGEYVFLWILQFFVVLFLALSTAKDVSKEETKEVVETVYIKGDLR